MEHQKISEVVFIATPALGNLVPLIEFTRHLTRHHPNVTATVIIITFPHRPLLLTYTRSLTTTTPRIIHLPTMHPPTPDHPHSSSSIGLTSFLIDLHKPLVKNTIIKLATESSTRITALFVDMFSTTMVDIAHELDIDCYLFYASPASFLGFVIELPSLEDHIKGMTKNGSSIGDELVVSSFVNPLPRDVLPSVLLDGGDGLSWLCYHGKRYKKTKGIVINSFAELEDYAFQSLRTITELPVYSIGPVIDLYGSVSWHPDVVEKESVVKWLDDQPEGSVVYLCFGSMGTLSRPQVHNIAAGLECAGFRFLWSIRDEPIVKFGIPGNHRNPRDILPQGFLDRTSEVGLVCGWVPQVKILAHRSIKGFVSHCGWNSILESLWHGVPIATWPLYAEQQMNAFELVRELGLAVEIKVDYRDGGDLVSAEEVERGVRRLMDCCDEVRQKVKKIGEIGRRALMVNGSSWECLEKLGRELTCNARNLKLSL